MKERIGKTSLRATTIARRTQFPCPLESRVGEEFAKKIGSPIYYPFTGGGKIKGRESVRKRLTMRGNVSQEKTI